MQGDFVDSRQVTGCHPSGPGGTVACCSTGLLDAEFSADTGLEAYADWSLGVPRGVGPLALELAWSDTSLDGDFGIRRGPGVNDGRLVPSLSSSLPW